jgi:PAS domain S-box-containing protein
LTRFDMQNISAQEVLETSRNAILILDQAFTVVAVNRAFEALFATTQQETLGRPLFDLGDRQWDIPALHALLKEVIPAHDAVGDYEVEHDFPGVGPRTIVLNATRIERAQTDDQYILLVLEDVTLVHRERANAERAWRLAETIVDSVRDPLVVLEQDMTVVTASRNFLRLFKVPADQVIGRRLADLGEGQWSVPTLRQALDWILPDGSEVNGFEIEDEFPGLGRRIFKLNARKVFRPGNHVTRLLVVFEDITEARHLERHKDVLAAELAHRIKNSLQIITGFVAYEIRRASEPCIQGYQAMQARIGAVAELYDVISRSSTLGPVAVEPYLMGIAGSIRSSLLGPDSRIEIAVKAEPLEIPSDIAVPFGLIVNELATNAVKHAFPDGQGRIDLGCHRRGGEIVLTVSDNGVGVEASAPATTSGLGSRFIDAFARQMGGVLARATGAGGGTAITVRLPMHDPQG